MGGEKPNQENPYNWGILKQVLPAIIEHTQTAKYN